MFNRKTKDWNNCIKPNIEQWNENRGSQSSGKVVIYALMMHDMCRPHKVDDVTQSMKPIFNKIEQKE